MTYEQTSLVRACMIAYYLTVPGGVYWLPRSDNIGQVHDHCVGQTV